MKLGLGVTVLAAAFALTACGGSGAKLTTKEQAVQATFAAENAANEATSSSGGAMKKALSRLASGAVGSASASYDCKKGGSITAKVSVEGDDDSAQIHASLDFNGCVTSSYTDPKTKETKDVSTDGTLSYDIGADETSLSVGISGHLDFSGGIDDSVDLEDVTFSAVTSGTSSSVSISGKISTSTQTYTFDSTDTFTFDGTISAAP